MKKIFWVVPLVLLLLGGAAFLAQRYWKEGIQPLQVADALPDNALMILSVPDWAAWESAQKDQPLREALAQTGLMQRLQLALNSAYPQLGSVQQPDVLDGSNTAANAEQTEGATAGASEDGLSDDIQSQAPQNNSAQSRSITSAVYITAAGSVDLLLISPDKEKIPATLEPYDRYEGVNIYRTEVGDQSWLEIRQRGLRVGSFSRVLIEDAIRQMQKSKRNDQGSLERVRELSSKSGEPVLLVNLPELSSFLGAFVRPEYANALQGLAEFSGWLAFNMQFQPSSLMLSGYAAPSPEQQLARFSKPDTQRIQVEKVLPQNTALLWRMSGGASSLFRPDFLAAVGDLGDPWLDFQGGEWAYAVVELQSDSLLRSSLFALRLSQIESAALHLGSISDADGNYRDVAIRRFQPEQSPLSIRFGRSLSVFDRSWFAIVDNYLLTAADRSTLVYALDQHSQSRSLSLDPGYIAFRQRLLPSANAYLYFSLPGLSNIATGMAPERSQEALASGLKQLEALQPFALQFDRYRDLFLCSGFLDYGPRLRSSDEQLWSVQLDTALTSAPRMVTDHRDGRKEILLEDKSHQIYLLDRGGKILWKRKLSGEILGDVHQLDYYRNGKLQYLFNTADKLYLIDRNGADVADYPISLTAGAGTGVAVFDYEKNRDYRIFVGASGENVYGYYQTGKPLPGWSPLRQAGPLAFPVQHQVQGDRDYLLLLSKSGRLTLKDRKGDNRQAPIELGAPLLAPFQWVDGPDPAWVSCDTLGNLIRVRPNEPVSRLPLPRVDGQSAFRVWPGNSEQAAGLVMTSGDRLTMRDINGPERWSMKLPDSGPHIWAHTDPGSGLLGLWSAQSGEWNLTDAAGALVSGFPMPGSGPFSVVPLIGAGEWTLVGERDGRVVARRVQVGE